MKSLFLLLLSAALVAPGAAVFGVQAERPNVIVILVDDQRVGMLGSEGHPFSRTPELDSISRKGARFTSAYVTTPLCSPARASFLTGLYAGKHGVRGNGDSAALSHRLQTFPMQLQRSGYETAFVGKWHMGNDPTARPGFDRWVSFRGQGVYIDPLMNIGGEQVRREGYITDILSEEAARFVRKSREKPFCLYVSHKSMHGPFTPAPRHAQLYAGEQIQRGPGAADDLSGKPALTREVMGQPAVRAGGGSGEALIRNQLRCLKSIDEGVGLILRALRETAQEGNTLLIYTSDNGYYWGEHGLGDKRWAYEEGVGIPLLAQWPDRVKPGQTISSPVLNVDLAPTLLEAAGAPDLVPVHGRSFLGLMLGRQGSWRDSYLMEYFAEPRYPRHPSWKAVRRGDWKLIHYVDLEGSDELYNLREDPYELKNRIADPAAVGARAQCRRELAMLLDVVK